MSTAIRDFLEASLGIHGHPWNIPALQTVSRLNIPEGLYGTREELLRGDIHFVWARWFLESICDPTRFLTNPGDGFAHVVAAVLGYCKRAFPNMPRDEVVELSKGISKLLMLEIERRRGQGREALGLDERRQLIDAFGPKLRCWLCGYEFQKAAIRRFSGDELLSEELSPLPFVDCMTGKGGQVRDLGIEVDHALPISAGGKSGDNLRLACGWCNRHKSDNLSLYDQALRPFSLRHHTLGRITVPRPFWVVRILSPPKAVRMPRGLLQDDSQRRTLRRPEKRVWSDEPGKHNGHVQGPRPATASPADSCTETQICRWLALAPLSSIALRRILRTGIVYRPLINEIDALSELLKHLFLTCDFVLEETQFRFFDRFPSRDLQFRQQFSDGLQIRALGYLLDCGLKSD